MLDVGVIGVGPQWETRYRPAVLALRHRLRVRAVAAPVTAIAEAAAADFQAEAVASLTVLAERPDIRALLLLEASWHGEFPVLLAHHTSKPVFLGRLADAELASTLEQLGELSSVIMPELPLRYTPATQRLRELLATRLGRVLGLTLELPEASRAPDDGRLPLVDALDWCRSLVGDCVARVKGVDDGIVRLSLSRASGESVPVEVRWLSEPNESLRTAVQCQRGTACIRGGRRLVWQCGQAETEEVLESDRGALELMLDHFSRRAVGGLVPIPTLDDIISARKLASLIDHAVV